MKNYGVATRNHCGLSKSCQNVSLATFTSSCPPGGKTNSSIMIQLMNKSFNLYRISNSKAWPHVSTSCIKVNKLNGRWKQHRDKSTMSLSNDLSVRNISRILCTYSTSVSWRTNRISTSCSFKKAPGHNLLNALHQLANAPTHKYF